jgi:phage gp29-like protein
VPYREASYPLGVSSQQPLQIDTAPRVVAYQELPWDALVSILKQAERGNTEKLADLSRRMLTDGHLASNVETRKLAIATAKLAIEPANPDDEIDVRGAADAQRMLDGLPMSRVKKDLADGIWVGWALCQILWEARGTWIWPKDVVWNHPRRFRFGWNWEPYVFDDGRAMAGQKDLSPEEQKRCRDLNIQGLPLEPYRWLVHMPRAYPDFPQVGGVCLAALRAWWIKANALRYQLAGAEMLGNGRVHGEQDPAADAATKAAFLDNLANWGATGVLVTTPGAKVNLTQPLAQGSSSVWSSLIQEMNSEESKAVLGSTLAVEAGPTGSRAQAETQVSATIDPRAEVDDDEIRHTIHRDLVEAFLELNAINYGRKPNVRTRSVWVEEEATIDEVALKTGYVKVNQFLTSRGLPPLENGGDEFIKLDGVGMLPGLPAPSADLPTAADGTKVEAVADTALNGAQVTSLSELLAGVAAGTLAPEAAILFIVSSFPSIPQERAQAMVNAQAAMAQPKVADPAVAPAAAPPPLAPGSKWRDSTDDHTLTITSAHGGSVYFTDEDYVDPKAGPQPNRQHRYAEVTFRERCVPIGAPAAPGGAPAASPLPDTVGATGADDGGKASDTALSAEAHGDLWALSDAERSNALGSLGHPGLLTAQAMLDGVPLFARLRSSLIDACGKATSVATLSGVLAAWGKRKSAPLQEQLYETALHARMAGALFVATYEAPEAFETTRALDDRPVPPFLALPFDEAISAFERRRIVSPEEFAGMDEDAREEAFTATRLAHEVLISRARDLLLRTLRDGGTFADFRTALVEDESALGVTPSHPWYLETVYRTNVQMAYGAGRLELLTSPAVAAVRPYLERRTARDDRVRDTHAALEGAVFAQSNEALVDAYSPPYLDGELQFNCRCVLVARRAADVDLSRLFTG